MEEIYHRIALGECIKKLRIEQGLSQKTLAKKAQIAQSTLVYIECGLKSPNIDTVFRLCKSLSISMPELGIKVDELLSKKLSESMDSEAVLPADFYKRN